MTTPIYGHESAETAYLVDDYPYGFRLRCKIRYWLEHKPKHGYRLVSQTTNPKRGDAWNKPKAGTYSPLAAMYLDENGHVKHLGVGLYTSPEKYAEFRAMFPGLPEREARHLQALERISRKYEAASWAAFDAAAIEAEAATQAA